MSSVAGIAVGAGVAHGAGAEGGAVGLQGAGSMAAARPVLAGVGDTEARACGKLGVSGVALIAERSPVVGVAGTRGDCSFKNAIAVEATVDVARGGASTGAVCKVPLGTGVTAEAGEAGRGSDPG